MDHVPDEQAHARDEPDNDEGVQQVPERRAMPDYEPTGVDGVDRVLSEVAAVAGAPIGEHVQVFERAHDQLRRALDAQPGPAGDGDQGS